MVNDFFQTNIPNVYAVGDVIGFPALASTSLEQGRIAACHAFGLGEQRMAETLPYGIFTVPEIGMVGKTEQQLSAEKVPYEIGIARFSEIERGKIIGDNSGVLKILFHRNTLQVLGIHIIGHNATELIHVGQLIMNFDGTIEKLAHNVFNYPSLSQAYKTAALDGLNKVIATRDVPDDIKDIVEDELRLN